MRPDAALVAIDFGAGPGLAETLRKRGIPYAFATGDDPETFPAANDDIERRRKPVPLHAIVAAAATLVGNASHTKSG